MKIRMTQSIRGSLNGVTVDDLVEGQDYETVNTPVGDRMARAHIANYVAIELGADGNPVIAEIVAPDEPVPTPAPAPGPLKK